MADGGSIVVQDLASARAEIARLTAELAKPRRKVPRQKPGESEQVVCTPRPFLDAIEKRFGPIQWDLAASAENCVVLNAEGTPSRAFFGEAEDSLSQDWSAIDGLLFCNPPFANVGHWLKKASEESSPTTQILVLTQASVGANWYWEHCRTKAVSWILKPRLQFVGHATVFPKDLALHWFCGGATGFGRWPWNGSKSR